MINLPELMFMNNKTDLPSREFIQYTRYPYHTAEVVWLQTEADEMQFLSKYDGSIFTNIAGYRIYVLWQGTLINKLPLSADTTNHINDFILKAANYYYAQRINPSSGRYSRFAVGNRD